MPRNLITKVQQYLDAKFPKRDAYSLGVTLASISAIAGNSLKTHKSVPIQTKSNIYVLLCGPSNSGKSAIANYGMELLDGAQYKNILTDDTTPEALTSFFMQHPYALIKMDEFTKAIGSYTKKTYMAGFRESLIKAYDGTELVQLRSTRVVAQAKNYSLTALCDTQPFVIAQEVGEADVSSGFLPRFNWFHVVNPERVQPQNVGNDVLREKDEIIKTYSELYKFALKHEIEFKFSNDNLYQIHSRLSPYQTTENQHFAPFYERTTLFAYKYAMLYDFSQPHFIEHFNIEEEKDDDTPWASDGSITHNRTAHEVDITSAGVSWAIEFVQDMLKNSLPITLKYLKLNDSDKIIDAIENYKHEKNAPMPESLLYRSVVHTLRDSRRIENAIKLAMMQDYIQQNRVQGGINYSLFGEFTPKKVEEYASNKSSEPIVNEEDEE